MKVLLILTDLYKTTGGGQTVYRQIIESSPEIDFFYFIDGESLDAPRPSNAYPIKLKSRVDLKVLAPPPFSNKKKEQMEIANQYARSVSNEIFDIVDIPDFYTFGAFLRGAFLHHEVSFKKIVLALHGNISDSIERNWGSTGDNVFQEREFERLQFESVDEVYGISRRYINEWQCRFDRNVKFIDPISFVKTETQLYKKKISVEKPSLFCIGRSERRKGNDIFVELVKWMRPDSINQASHVGCVDYSFNGISSEFLLKYFADHRDLKINYFQTLEPSQLREIFSQKSIVVLPVRYDTLNLIALEALFSGCPVAVSSKAGVCEYLDEFYPGIPYLKIDLDNLYGSVPALQNLVDEYDEYRSRLEIYLESNKKLQPAVSINRFYFEILSNDNDVNSSEVYLYIEGGKSLKRTLVNALKDILPINFFEKIRSIYRAPLAILKNSFKRSKFFDDAKFIDILFDSLKLQNHFKKISEFKCISKKSIREKLDRIYDFSTSPIYRCNFWLEIAEAERSLGNELIAVTYELRVLRLLGEDHFNLLPKIVDTLKRHNFRYEAEAAEAMFGSSVNSEQKVYDFLKNAYDRNLVREDKPWLVFEDNRSKIEPKVSVIVSLYNAADKLSNFLTALSCQTLVQKDQVEIILVDSGSPSDEKEVLDSFLAKNKLNLLYARSESRETIQAAWNRGIGLAKAPYLVFLGVDETLYPEALETLAIELDASPDVDWVMANSLVTAVDDSGCLNHDIMSYDRIGATKDHTYLETCYLSWVGGMYRKSIHDRFGYYDESFGAAGDTEIKNRILPYINVKFIPKVLGLFLNYPDGQTTASPKAEIEDLRAWYIHRSLGGVRYAFENRSLADAKSQFYRCLGYRKSYCGHMSSDLEYAVNLLEHLSSRGYSGKAVKLLSDLKNMIEGLRSLEALLSEQKSIYIFFRLIRLRHRFFKYQRKHRGLTNSFAWPCYSVFNDNRYEQHSWLWKSN